MQGEGAEGRIVRVGKGIDYGVEGVAADDVVFVLWRPVSDIEEYMGGEKRTGSFNKSIVMLQCQKRVWEFPEELFQQSRNTIYVVEEVLWVAEVNFGGIYYELACIENQNK